MGNDMKQVSYGPKIDDARFSAVMKALSNDIQ